MVNVADISARDWSPTLSAFGEIVTGIEDIAQCIRVICMTRKGSVPLRRNFGSDIWKWLDKPLEVAQTNIPLAIYEAMSFEPRVVMKSVTVDMGEQAYELVVTVDWELADQPEVTETTVITSGEILGAGALITEAVVTAAIESPVVVPDFEQIYEIAETT